MEGGEKKGRKYDSEPERSTVKRKYLAQPWLLLEKTAVERGRVTKRKHKQEKQKRITQGQDCSASGKGAQAQQPLEATGPSFHWSKRLHDSRISNLERTFRLRT
jgi:hypothetical protein